MPRFGELDFKVGRSTIEYKCPFSTLLQVVSFVKLIKISIRSDCFIQKGVEAPQGMANIKAI